MLFVLIICKFFILKEVCFNQSSFSLISNSFSTPHSLLITNILACKSVCPQESVPENRNMIWDFELIMMKLVEKILQ